ncbi:dienelactone hydrolase family protein [Pseudonocardia benzenivorans]|jgi:carboxymethylenebutenolidase|uniref:Dienelactone hydrolase n=2 Tax=Pseudonocardia TaxID=1847 RepID=F4CM23_PSEUX|nr:dienelactone hydrolase family protein [Pseudonocardia dioxanivorans]AEA22510.1 dienelactone hydrolase [Pseudonocardia dioxanivorans CB1190]GJF01375.1 carboxymethylenebutenolidase [Pseudonocardia sp. D17]
MTEIRTETVPLVDGSRLRLTVAEPDGSVRGGIVVLQEARGVTESVRNIVSGMAGDGWLAVAPHLYHRDGADELDADSPDEHVQEQLDKLDREEIMADTDTAFGWLAEHDVPPDRMGVVGFDIGGSVALLVAAKRAFGAAVTVGGGGVTTTTSEGLDELLDAASALTCPWLGIYGSPADGGSHDDVDALREAADRARVATDLVTYPLSGHRFDADPDAAAEAWQRMLNWFGSHLR